eukprot:gene10453-21813_t
MLVNVKFFASCREQTGLNSISIEIPGDFSNTTTLKGILLSQFPVLNAGMEEVSLAVNKKYIREEVILRDGDEVALIPPISGG